MQSKIDEIKKLAEEKISKIKNSQDLQELKVQFLGKKSELSNLVKGLGALTAEERPKVGALVNEARKEIEEKLSIAEEQIKSKMLEEKIDFKKCDEVGTILYVAIDKKYVGYVLIADKIKQDSSKTIRELKAMNIKETVMLTGDKKEVGEYVAKKLNMDKVYTELLPDGKVEKVEELLKQKSEKGKLVFVGDGINDAPVLTISDIGVAMGGLGSDAAIEAADIVIMTDEPSKINKGWFGSVPNSSFNPITLLLPRISISGKRFGSEP